MKRLLLLNYLLFTTLISFSNSIVVNNIDELNKANKDAKPGDIILLQNGVWDNVTIALNCNGTKEHPIVFKAQSAGKVIISGKSKLKLGGNYIVVDGLLFENGYAGNDAVINFRIDNKQLANNCRVTNCVVNDFNNPKRMEENNWVLFYGKNNRLDHNSFYNKKNMGVLLAVILDDDRSRENYHSIDHNYFGIRLPLASNGGEIIRVGVSQHCEFTSGTQIVDNYFEHCDGETEIISIKSCYNIVRNNLFKECQGGVVLRHGNYNTVENNIFLGNDKEGTGGVRVINKGQWVINNLFYKCRGVDFRSPLSVMNGIPNSPAFRYVQVTDAVIANNTFYNCSSISFCEGSDTERVLPPANVALLNNIFYNDRDSIIYKAFDNISGFNFAGNEISKQIKQDVVPGFMPAAFTTQKNDAMPFVVSGSTTTVPDSLQQAAKQRLRHTLSTKKGFSDLALIKKIQANAWTNCGAKWFTGKNNSPAVTPKTVSCKTAEEVYLQLSRKEAAIIRLTGNEYKLDKPFFIPGNVQFTSGGLPVTFNTTNTTSVFMIGGNGNLSLLDLAVNGKGVMATHFISNDTSGSSDHYNLSVRSCSFSNLDRGKGCRDFFYGYKYMIADSIVIRQNTFINNAVNTLIMNEEKDDKGYYSAEKIMITENSFSSLNGTLLDIYRGGNDESTMGPLLIVKENSIINCSNSSGNPLITLYGVQKTFIEGNIFRNANTGTVLIRYEDKVRAAHSFKQNSLTQSGKVVTDKFVVAVANDY